jgi:AraC-like DNA-binding protein
MVEHKRTRRAQDERIPPWGVAVIESHHAVGFEMTERQHPFLKILFIQEGAGHVHLGRQVVDCREGDIVVVPIGRKNWIEDSPDQPISVYVLCIMPEVWAMDRMLVKHVPVGRVSSPRVVAGRVRSLMRQMLFEQSDPQTTCGARMAAGALQTMALLVEVSARTPDNESHRFDAAEAVRTYASSLSRRFYELQDLESIAAELGMSRRRFTQLFRQVSGQSWLQRVRELRLDHAERLLEQSKRTTTAIAFECGFGDLSTFYRAFKTRHTLSPIAWRKKRGRP